MPPSVWRRLFPRRTPTGTTNKPTRSSRSRTGSQPTQPQAPVGKAAPQPPPEAAPQKIVTVDHSKKKNWPQSYKKGRVEYKAGRLAKFGSVWKISYGRQRLVPSPTESLTSMQENYPEVMLLTYNEALQWKAQTR